MEEELLEQIDNLREIALYFNQYLLQIATWETPTRTVMEQWQPTSPAPGMFARLPETLVRREKPGMPP